MSKGRFNACRNILVNISTGLKALDSPRCLTLGKQTGQKQQLREDVVWDSGKVGHKAEKIEGFLDAWKQAPRYDRSVRIAQGCPPYSIHTGGTYD
jgi:hypothetical protein